MLTVITGPPGGFKTTRLLHLAYSTNRPILHNMEELPLTCGCNIPLHYPDGQDITHYFRMMTHDNVPSYHGSVILIDEAQDFFQLFPDDIDIMGFFENHCSYDIDIYLALQDSKLLPSFLYPESYWEEFYSYRRVDRLLRFFGFIVCSRSFRRRSRRVLNRSLVLRRFSFSSQSNINPWSQRII
ncbi:MAG: hypothetical protein GY804_15540 [Alphaproteobacteria bacterium]|nr:hypothetical protein [Alphaproteobacteria bacterium]